MAKGMYEAEAKERQKAGGKAAGNGRKKVEANFPQPKARAKQSRDKAAEAVDHMTVNRLRSELSQSDSSEVAPPPPRKGADGKNRFELAAG